MIEVAQRDGVALMPNPHQVSLERFAEFTPEQQADMQDAYVALQASAGRSVDDNKCAHPSGSVIDHIPFYEEVGFDRFTDAFMNLRYVAGEDEFTGLRPVHLGDTERTPLLTYLEHAARRRLIVTEWDRHDLRLHIMGALLTDSRVGSVIRESSDYAQSAATEDQKSVGRSIDAATFAVNCMWKFPADLAQNKHALQYPLDRMRVVAMKGAMSMDDVDRTVDQQAEFIRGFVAKDLFVPTNPIR